MNAWIARLAVGSLLFASAAFAAEGEAPRRFAAPDIAATPPAGSAGGIGQVLFALIIVLVAVFVAAVLLKRLRNFSGGGSAGIEVLASAAVGPKERVVIVRVAGDRLLLGVAAGQVSLLQKLPVEGDLLPPGTLTPTPGFADLLRRSLGR